MISLRALWHGCWKGHGDEDRVRRGKSYVVVCVRCGTERTFPKVKKRYRDTSKVTRASFGKKKSA
jgi:hypothetical protein